MKCPNPRCGSVNLDVFLGGDDDCQWIIKCESCQFSFYLECLKKSHEILSAIEKVAESIVFLAETELEDRYVPNWDDWEQNALKAYNSYTPPYDTLRPGYFYLKGRGLL